MVFVKERITTKQQHSLTTKSVMSGSHKLGLSLIGPQREKTFLQGFANNTGADQPVHPRNLISAFVIRLLESIIYKLTTGEIAIFYLVSVAEESGLKLALSKTLKAGFLEMGPNYYNSTKCVLINDGKYYRYTVTNF